MRRRLSAGNAGLKSDRRGGFELSLTALAVVVGTMCVYPAAAHARSVAGDASGSRAAAGPALLQQMVLDADGNGATLTLSLSSPVEPRLLRLHAPERLVIDLPATLRRSGLPQPGEGGVVTALRSGMHDQHTLRLVLELKQSLQAQCQPVTDGSGYRLRIVLGRSPAPVAPLQASAAVVPPAATAAADAAASPAPPAVGAPRAQAHGAARNVRAAHAPLGERAIVIAVDAGHGGDDPGATGRSGTHEKDVTLAIARALALRIDRQPGLPAVLTRDGDYFVELRDRMRRARAAHADMFVSIHADAVRDREVSGASVYILSERGASSEAARTLAEQENAADLKGGISLAEQRPDVRSVLLDLSQNASIGESVEAADRVLGALDRVGAVRKREVQQAAFVVLKSPDIPSMLVETAYISNPAEERKLRTAQEQQRLAEAIFSGIDGYFRKYPPEGSRYAREHGRGESGIELARAGF